MLDATFLRPIAHRGLHSEAKGIIENTAEAFQAAMAKGYAIECDLQPASDGTPVVFHDETLDRLVAATGRIDARSPAELAGLRYKDGRTRIITLADMLALVGGTVPLVVEIKSEWGPPARGFLPRIAGLCTAYDGPLALMSFDPAIMAAVRELAPGIPRGIVSGLYQGPGWWADKLDPERAFRLSHLLESEPAAPDFYSYHVKALPTPVTRFVREVARTPLIAWTVRTGDDRRIAERWADAPTFEGYEP